MYEKLIECGKAFLHFHRSEMMHINYKETNHLRRIAAFKSLYRLVTPWEEEDCCLIHVPGSDLFDHPGVGRSQSM